MNVCAYSSGRPHMRAQGFRLLSQATGGAGCARAMGTMTHA